MVKARSIRYGREKFRIELGVHIGLAYLIYNFNMLS